MLQDYAMLDNVACEAPQAECNGINACRKRVHDERIKLWCWKVMAVATLIGSVLHISGENKMASPLGNSILMSVTIVFEQVRQLRQQSP